MLAPAKPRGAACPADYVIFARGIPRHKAAGEGSKPLPGTPRSINNRRYAPVAQLDRALPSEGRGREFESRRVRHFFCSVALVGSSRERRSPLRESRQGRPFGNSSGACAPVKRRGGSTRAHAMRPTGRRCATRNSRHVLIKESAPPSLRVLDKAANVSYTYFSSSKLSASRPTRCRGSGEEKFHLKTAKTVKTVTLCCRSAQRPEARETREIAS